LEIQRRRAICPFSLFLFTGWVPSTPVRHASLESKRSISAEQSVVAQVGIGASEPAIRTGSFARRLDLAPARGRSLLAAGTRGDQDRRRDREAPTKEKGPVEPLSSGPLRGWTPALNSRRLSWAGERPSSLHRSFDLGRADLRGLIGTIRSVDASLAAVASVGDTENGETHCHLMCDWQSWCLAVDPR
jgi:hypothetical protein